MELGLPFEWKLEVITGVGHESCNISQAAAEFLYKE